MKEQYVTLFDSLFLPQGLALHRSMERHIREYTLWVLCVDDIVYEVLEKLMLPNIKLLRLAVLETNELKAVKKERTKGEYCWTLTPFAPRFVFEADESVLRVTYIDADIWFRKNPSEIFKEFDESGKKVLITDHAYAHEYDQSATSGQYCVQFMTFTRHGGEKVRKWWEEKCIDWCYAKYDKGRFGDQKYLDDWPVRFEELVHVLKEHYLIQAPWNAIRFSYENAVIFHFHGLRLVRNEKVSIGHNYILPDRVLFDVYKLYLLDLKSGKENLREIGYIVNSYAKSKYIISYITVILREVYKKIMCYRLNSDIVLP